MTVVEPDGRERLLREALGEADVIVNGILQDTGTPLMFLEKGEERFLKKNCLVVDVSCDLGMGFPFARPTSFDDPVFDIGECVYYAVDHSPSWLWRSASWEISRVVVPFIETVPLFSNVPPAVMVRSFEFRKLSTPPALTVRLSMRLVN